MNAPAIASVARPRSGERSALLALALLVPAPSIGAAFGLVLFPGTLGSVVYGLCKVWMFALPALWWLLIDKQRPSLSPARLGGFGPAIMLGVAISAIIFAAYFTVGVDLIESDTIKAVAAQNKLTDPATYLALCAYLIFINSVLEEYVYRWFIFRKCEHFMPAWAAVLVSAACFTVHHVIALKAQMNWTVTIIGSAGVFTGGAVWSWLYLRYRSVWPGYVSHAIVDVAIFILGYKLIFA